MRVRVFPTVGDELILQNACDMAKVKLEFGGAPHCDGRVKGFERPLVDGVKSTTDWFIAYLVGEELQIKHARAIFLTTRDSGIHNSPSCYKIITESMYKALNLDIIDSSSNESD